MGEEIADEYQVHMLNDQGVAKARKLAEAFSTLQREALTMAGKPSRETSLMTTNLQVASYWAKRAMAMNPDNQK